MSKIAQFLWLWAFLATQATASIAAEPAPTPPARAPAPKKAATAPALSGEERMEKLFDDLFGEALKDKPVPKPATEVAKKYCWLSYGQEKYVSSSFLGEKPSAEACRTACAAEWAKWPEMWGTCKWADAEVAKRAAAPSEAGDCRIIVRERMKQDFVMRKDYSVSEEACVDACWTWARSANWDFECSWERKEFSPIAPQECRVGPPAGAAGAARYTSREHCARKCLKAREKEKVVCSFGGADF